MKRLLLALLIAALGMQAGPVSALPPERIIEPRFRRPETTPTPTPTPTQPSRGDRVRAWCGSYSGRADTTHACVQNVNVCWDVCHLPDGSTRHFEGPYLCGICIGIGL